MARSMDELLEELCREHFPYPPATRDEIEQFEHRVSWRLDADLRAFYLRCNGAELFKPLPNAPYQILPLSEIVRARVAMRGEDDERWGPASIYVLCDVQDGDYALLDVGQREEGRHPLVDGYHEAWPDPAYRRRIARSFSEFLDQALRSEGRIFYLQPARE